MSVSISLFIRLCHFVIGTSLAPQQREKLAGVARGEDPSAERHAVRAGMSVSEVCDWYLEEAEAGRILGRVRRCRM